MPAGRARRRNPVCWGGIARCDSEDVAGTARDAQWDVRAFLESMSDSTRADRSCGPARSVRDCRVGVRLLSGSAYRHVGGSVSRPQPVSQPSRDGTAQPRGRGDRVAGEGVDGGIANLRGGNSRSNERNSASELPVLLARLPQGRRRGIIKSLILVAHRVQALRVVGTVTLTPQARVALELVDRLSTEVVQPRFDTPAGHDHENRVVVISPRDALSFAFRIQFGPPVIGGTSVRIGNDDEIGALPPADGFQLPGVLLSNPLFARLTSSRQWGRRDVATAEVAPLEEPPHERIRLRVFAEQRDVDPAHSLSHPRTIASESETPSTGRSGWSLTRTGPFPSR